MNPKAREIFTHAAVMAPEKRESYLAEACGDDAELRLEVQRLLVDFLKADSFFSNDKGATVGADALDVTYTEAEGDEIGPYTLRQQIGEGGFGAVWMAEQSGAISRMVALKVVKAGMDTKQVLSRFEAERQALAMMDHPNIAKVLDAGATPAGRPYFAMELVKGMPITQFCDQQKFGPRQRLELFKDVCAAVNHAHQKGIIHRDLKPSNIMVTLAADVPVVKVIDFGIAKATHSKLTEKTLFTRFEQFLGTPVYMSPEQAAMSAIDVDTRSDIYSLGVLLYELLAGAPPFDQKSLLSAGYDEMRRIIAEDEPPKPSTRCTETQAGTAAAAVAKPRKFHVSAAALKGELDWIVMKAIEKDRTRRYETANAFAADIGRYLDDEPVLAAAPSAAYKLRKFARRNKAAFGVGAAMVALLLAGIAATGWQAVRATAESARANAEKNRAIAAQEDAEAISAFLTGMFERAKPGKEKGGIDVKVVEIIDDAAGALDADQAVPPERRAMLQTTLADTYDALGLYRKAIPLAEKVCDYHLATSGPEHLDTLEALHDLAHLYDNAGLTQRAMDLFEATLLSSRDALGSEHPKTQEWSRCLARSYGSEGDWDKALAALSATDRETGGRPMGGEDSSPTSEKQAAILAHYNEAFERVRAAKGPEHRDTLGAMNFVAFCYHASGRRKEAIAVQEEILAHYTKVFGPEDPLTLRAMNYLALFYYTAGRRDEALEMREDVVTLRRKVLGPEHPATLMAINDLAASYREADRLHEAIPMQEEVLALCRKTLGPEHPLTGRAAASLGFLLDKLDSNGNGDATKTIAAWQEAVRINPKNADIQYWLGRLLVAKNRLEEAVVTLRAASDLYPAPHPRGLEMRERLAEALDHLAREEEAAWVRRGVVQERRKLPGPVSEDSFEVRAVIVAPTSEWKWLHPRDGSDPKASDPDFHTTFFTDGFDDSGWQRGTDSDEEGGGFGYGEDWFTGIDIGLPGVADAEGKRNGKSAYFRHRFTTDTAHANLELRCQFDDGIIVYLDGKEVTRLNMPEGEDAYDLPASSAVSQSGSVAFEEQTTYQTPLKDLTLAPGEHILAISLHNTSNPSSDLRIGGITLVEVEGTVAK